MDEADPKQQQLVVAIDLMLKDFRGKLSKELYLEMIDHLIRSINTYHQEKSEAIAKHLCSSRAKTDR